MHRFSILFALAACVSHPAPPDAGPCPDGVKEIDCEVAVECAGAPSHTEITLCDRSNDGPQLEARASAAAAQLVSCSAGPETFAATCTAAPDAITCPLGFELEDATVCIPGTTYDADTTDLCQHLPAAQGACSVACDRAALYAYAIDGAFTTYTCETTDGVQFVVGAAPMTGNGAR